MDPYLKPKYRAPVQPLLACVLHKSIFIPGDEETFELPVCETWRAAGLTGCLLVIRITLSVPSPRGESSVIITRVRSTTGGYIFTGVCLFRRGGEPPSGEDGIPPWPGRMG